MSWYLPQLAAWLVVLAPTLFVVRWLLGRIRHMRCGVPLMLIVLTLAAALALLVTPVVMPLGALILPYSAWVVMLVSTSAKWGEPYLGLSWDVFPPAGFSMALTFLLASALIWMLLQHRRR